MADILQSLTVGSFIKFALILLIIGYIIFAFVILVQVRTMNNIISQTIASKSLVLGATFLIILGISLLLAAFVIL